MTDIERPRPAATFAEAEGKEAEATVNLKVHLEQSLKARYQRVEVGRE